MRSWASTRSANDEEVRRGYKRQREIYATGGLSTASLLDADQLAGAQRKLDEAYDTLLDPGWRRRAYDLSTFPSIEPEALSARTTTARPRRPSSSCSSASLQREIGPDSEFSGSLLRQGARVRSASNSPTSARRRKSRGPTCNLSKKTATGICRRSSTHAAFLVELAPNNSASTRCKCRRLTCARLREELSAGGRELA